MPKARRISTLGQDFIPFRAVVFILLLFLAPYRYTNPYSSMQLTITPGLGLGPISFGLKRNQVKEKLGEPTEVEQDEENDELEYWHYDDLETTLTFDRSESGRLSSILSSHGELTLFGARIVGMNRPALLALFEKKGHKKLDFDESQDGDQHIEIVESEELELLIWLIDGQVSEAQFGPFFTDEATINWPV